MKKLVLGTITAAMIATTAFSADYTMKVSHVVSDSTPKGKAAIFLEIPFKANVYDYFIYK